MKRREWTFGVATLAGLKLAGCANEPGPPVSGAPIGAVPPALPAQPADARPAEPEPVEIRDYLALARPLPVALAPGKAVEVVEFFWYECPHCNAFEPMLVEWLGRQAADLQFRRMPVGFTPRHAATQRLYYALEATGDIERLHAKVFEAIHRHSRELLTEPEQTRFAVAEGVDRAAFAQALRSPQVAARMQAADALADAYGVDGVPSLGVHGRFYTQPGMAGTRQRTLAVVDALVRRSRDGR